MPLVPVLLLAAGSSSRMGGRDKLMIEVDGEPLLRRSAQRARATGQPVIVALPPAPHPRHEALAGLAVTKVPVPDAGEGMNASLRAALARVPGRARAVMILLADLPELTTADLETVLKAVESHPDRLIWRGTTSDGKPGHPVVFARDLWPELAALGGDGGAGEVVRRHAGQVEPVPLPGRHARLDLDTPEAWAEWLAGRRG